MWLSDISVKRPVAALVLSFLLCVFGIVSFSKLAVREYPDIDSPIVTITTRYAGAAPNIMEAQVTKVIEDQLSGISGIDTLTSISRDGLSRVVVKFKMDWNIIEGVSDVRDAVARAQRSLPDDADEPIVSKDDGADTPIVYVNLSSSSTGIMELTEYAQRFLEDKFSLLNGVSSVGLQGALYKVMYVQLDPVQMAGRGVTPLDISDALKTENLESPGGELRDDIIRFSVRTERLYQTKEDFEQLVVRRSSAGTPIYLKDVASVFIGAKNENSTYKTNGINSVTLGIVAQSGANPLDVAKEVRGLVEQLQPFIMKDVSLWIDYDSTIFIERSIAEVYSTLFMTGVLVVLILYIFIGQLRATLIPAVTVPVSLVSAFIAAYSLGFSINLLTLMALILAIGLVVDDAIVVVENIFHHIEKGSPPLVAAYQGTREVGFAVVATTAVLVMVFLPISFMDGMVGKLFTEFAVLLAMAVIFSSLIALTLTPMLASKMLRLNVGRSRFNQAVDLLFARLEGGYGKLLRGFIRFSWLSPLIIIGCIVGSVFLARVLPLQLVPQEDRGVLMMFVKGAEGTAYNRMVGNMELIEKRLLKLVDEKVLSSVSLQSPAFGGAAGDQTGFVIMQLVPWEQRSQTIQQVLKRVRDEVSGVPDVFVRIFMPGFRGGSNEPVQLVLNGSDYKTLNHYAQLLLTEANNSDILQGADLDYAETTPELVVKINRKRAAQLGINVGTIAGTLEVMLGGKAQTTFIDRGEEFDVYVRGNQEQFKSKEELSQIYLRTHLGDLVSLDTVVELEEEAGAQVYRHFEKKKSITLKASFGEGYELGDALGFLEEKAREILPPDISLDYAGESAQFKDNQSGVAIVFSLALLVAYLVLAAQFESFINPFVVMLTVPMGILGGLAGLWFSQQGLNIYSQIGMLMLIGMVTKNGILIVEFANQLRDQGVEFEKAIISAAVRRLRPILMTAFTTIIGAIPLIISTGAGFESRVAVGTVIFAGMAFSTIVTLFVIPTMYRLLSARIASPGAVAALLHEQLEAQKRRNIDLK
ncbi:MAG: efflux RND transporter permease subunit [Vibrionaceae bacterium]